MFFKILLSYLLYVIDCTTNYPLHAAFLQIELAALRNRCINKERRKNKNIAFYCKRRKFPAI